MRYKGIRQATIALFVSLALLWALPVSAAYAPPATEAMADASGVNSTADAVSAQASIIQQSDYSAYSANPDTTVFNENPLAFAESPLTPTDITVPAAVSLDATVDLQLPIKAGVLMSADTGEILYKQNMDEQLPVASITKIMTMLLVFDEIHKGNIALTDLVSVSEHAASMGGSQIWLDPSESFTVDEMLLAVCVSSANDAAVALAEHVAGSEAVFVDMMNRRAAELGMTNTNFVNACGLDANGHLSSAYDVALMAREIMKYDELVKYTTVWTDSLRDGQTMLVNTNKLIRSYAGITGLKTGTTSLAGVCICTTATRDDMSIIAVVLGAANSDDRFDAARTLMDFGFANFSLAYMPDIDNFLTEIPLKKGLEQSIEVEYNLPEKLMLQKNQDPMLREEINLPEYVTAPISKGDSLGTVTLYSGDSEIGIYDIFAAESYSEINFNASFKRFATALLEF